MGNCARPDLVAIAIELFVLYRCFQIICLIWRGKGQKGMVDCLKCKYYFVTWQKNLPHGCKAMKFKSMQIPSALVRKTSGQECMLFKRKIVRPSKSPDQPPKKTI